MALVTFGLTNKQVAAEIGLSEITVQIHRGHKAILPTSASSLSEQIFDVYGQVAYPNAGSVINGCG